MEKNPSDVRASESADLDLHDARARGGLPDHESRARRTRPRGSSSPRQQLHEEAVRQFQAALAHELGSMQVLSSIGLARPRSCSRRCWTCSRSTRRRCTCQVIVACALLALAFLAAAVLTRLKLFSGTERDPSWLTFLALSMVISFAVGYVEGGKNYQDMRSYYDFHNLNTYTDIYPNRMRGQQLMDAGMVQFTQGTSLDISKSEGFKQGTMYCVAPIVLGNETAPTYDFWAVGTGCCGSEGDFHCKGWNSLGYGGLRLMNNGQRSFYRLAVQQAEASYNITAVHPLFFKWTRDPAATVEGWERTAHSNFIVWIFSYLLFQCFCVATATMAFSRLGYL